MANMERPAQQAGGRFASPPIAGGAAVWLVLMRIVLRAAALSPEASGKVFVVFAPGIAQEHAFAAVAGAGGAPLRSVLGSWGWIAHDEPSGFVGRLEAAGALAA